MSDLSNVAIDFTDATPAGGFGYPKMGLNTARITEWKHYPAGDRGGAVFYLYMVTDGIQHRERFGVERGLPFMLSALISAGAPEKAVVGKKVTGKILEKTTGKRVFFHYTPPELDPNGKARKGSYPSYSFYTKDRYDAMVKDQEDENLDDVGDSEGDDDFDFLNEDEDEAAK